MSNPTDKADSNGISALDGYLGFSDRYSQEVEGISPQKRYFRYIRQGLRHSTAWLSLLSFYKLPKKESGSEMP